VGAELDVDNLSSGPVSLTNSVETLTTLSDDDSKPGLVPEMEAGGEKMVPSKDRGRLARDGPVHGGRRQVVERDLTVSVELPPQPPGAVPVVKVAGEVDIQTSPVLEERLGAILDDGQTSVVVDLGDVTFLDSTGLSVLISTLRRCRAAGGELQIVGPRPNVRKVLEITGLTDVFGVADDTGGDGADQTGDDEG